MKVDGFIRLVPTSFGLVPSFHIWFGCSPEFQPSGYLSLIRC